MSDYLVIDGVYYWYWRSGTMDKIVEEAKRHGSHEYAIVNVKDEIRLYFKDEDGQGPEDDE